MDGPGSSQGVIQVHADLTQWLTEEAEDDDQQHEQQAQWEADGENHYEDENSSGRFAAADSKTASPTANQHSSVANRSSPQPPQPHRSSPSKVSNPTQSTRTRKRPPPTFQPKAKKVTSYADKYAVTVGLKPVEAAAVTSLPATFNTASTALDEVEHLAANVDILVIAPFTADGVRPPSPPPCVDEAELAARYPDYFLDDTSATDEYEQADLLLHDHSAAAAPTTASSPSASYQPYTMSDFRTLPKEVKLGRLGASVDPADVEAREKKRRDMKQLEKQVREENRKRMERADKQRLAVNRVRPAAADTAAAVEVREEKLQEEVTEAVRQKPITVGNAGQANLAAVAARGAAKATAVKIESERTGDETLEDKRQAADGKARNVRRASMDRVKHVDKSSGKPKVRREAEKVDVVSQLLLEQEKERQKVQHIRQSLGLK